MDGRGYEAMDQMLSSVVRAEDFLGLHEGRLYLLLVDIAEDTTKMVQERLLNKGVRSRDVGDQL